MRFHCKFTQLSLQLSIKSHCDLWTIEGSGEFPYHSFLSESIALWQFEMEKYLSQYNIVRIIVTSACLIFFVLHSKQEIEKYFSNVTSFSTTIMTDKEVALRFPRIVICVADNPYKSDKFPETLEEYTNLTYSRDEVIGTIMGSTNTSHVTELATYRYGRCYVLEISPNEEIESHLIGFKIKKNLMVFFIDYGQELCIIYSVLHCDVLLHNVLLDKYWHGVKIRSKKTIREER